MRLSVISALLLSAACSPGPSAPAALRAGGFDYSASTAGGDPVLRGRINFEFTDDSTVTGTWTITWVEGADTTLEVGPQVGSGPLVGTRHGDTMMIQLNPNFADNNVGLVAVPTAQGWRGEWEWVAFTGPRSRGSFTASRP